MLICPANLLIRDPLILVAVGAEKLVLASRMGLF
jgi:hypothetical protein